MLKKKALKIRAFWFIRKYKILGITLIFTAEKTVPKRTSYKNKKSG